MADSYSIIENKKNAEINIYLYQGQKHDLKRIASVSGKPFLVCRAAINYSRARPGDDVTKLIDSIDPIKGINKLNQDLFNSAKAFVLKNSRRV